MRGLLGWVTMFALLLVAIVLGQLLTPLQDLDRYLQQHRVGYLLLTGGLGLVGFVLLMGSALDLIMSKGEPMNHEEVEDVSRSARDMAARPYSWRKSIYRLWGEGRGREGHDEFSFRTLKDAVRDGIWWRESVWRRRVIATAGALLLTIAIFGLFIVVGPPTVKLVTGGALLYALARTVWGFWKS